jgi:hypothetical protein
VICPYNRKSIKQVTQTVNEFEENQVKSYQTVLVEEYQLIECEKENCGAWNNERCNYNQGVNS